MRIVYNHLKSYAYSKTLISFAIFPQTQTSIFERMGDLWVEREEVLEDSRRNAAVVSLDNSRFNC